VSVTISASLVKELRDQTGAGMMDCKRALEETGGDIEAARKLLREKGMADAAKRSGRETTEGLVGYRISDTHGTMVAVGCETEPVSKNDQFQAFAKKVLDAVDAEGAGAVASLEQERQDLVAKLGENIVIVGTPARFEKVEGGVVNGYVHPPANKLGALVQLRGGSAELARKVAMHIAWTEPRWISRDDVPQELMNAEREIYLNSDEVQSKPEQAREKIVDGMMNKRFFAERGGVLLDQPWIHDQSQTVAQALQDAGAEVLEFERFSVAG
jgi:elongation factor Ts